MARITMKNNVRLDGMIEGKNVSAITFVGGKALVASDEVTTKGNVVQVFDPAGDEFVAAEDGLIVLDEPGTEAEEMDLEGLGVDGDTVYAIGSHSSKRNKVDPDKKYKKNLDALNGPIDDDEPARDVLLRFRFDAATGDAGPVDRSSLRGFLKKTEPFKTFRKVAGKENGVDVEGITVSGGFLHIGFRGPVLRGNFVPILRCRFGSPIRDPDVRYVNLGGRGVRDLVTVEGGMLILAGPVGDGPGSFQLYLWDGRDLVPGKGAPTSLADPGIELIGDLPIPPAEPGATSPAKAEGLAVVAETRRHWEILVVFDGLKDGQATRYVVRKA